VLWRLCTLSTPTLALPLLTGGGESVCQSYVA